MGEIIRHIDAVSAEIEREMRAARPAVQQHIQAFKSASR
jgi:hypothetical protein